MYFKKSKIVINFHCVNPAWYGKCCHIHLIWTTVFPALLFQETRAAAYGESDEVKHDEEEHPPDDRDDDDPGEDGGGGDGGGDEKGGEDEEPSDDESDEGPPAEFMQPKPKSMPKQPAPFLSPEAASGSDGRPPPGPPAPPDHPPGVPQPRHHGPPSDHHFKKMAAGFWIQKTPPPLRTSGDYRHVPDPIMCLELCLRKALLFTFKITIALALILWHFNVQTYPFI